MIDYLIIKPIVKFIIATIKGINFIVIWSMYETVVGIKIIYYYCDENLYLNLCYYYYCCDFILIDMYYCFIKIYNYYLYFSFLLIIKALFMVS